MDDHQELSEPTQHGHIVGKNRNRRSNSKRSKPYERSATPNQNVRVLVDANWTLQLDWLSALNGTSAFSLAVPTRQQQSPARSPVNNLAGTSAVSENRCSCSTISPATHQSYLSDSRPPMNQEDKKISFDDEYSEDLNQYHSDLPNNQSMVPSAQKVETVTPYHAMTFNSEVMLILMGFIRLWQPNPPIAYSMFVPFFRRAKPACPQAVSQNLDLPRFPPDTVVQPNTEGYWSATCGDIVVKMIQSDIWKISEILDKKMIVVSTEKQLYPRLSYTIEGLDAEKRYAVYLDFVLVDKSIWKFCFNSNEWIATETAQKEDLDNNENRVYYHPESPASGQAWNTKGIQFTDLKVTSNADQADGKVLLTSMRHYMPRLNIYEHDPEFPGINTGLRIFVMPKAAFIPVMNE